MFVPIIIYELEIIRVHLCTCLAIKKKKHVLCPDIQIFVSSLIIITILFIYDSCHFKIIFLLFPFSFNIILLRLCSVIN